MILWVRAWNHARLARRRASAEAARRGQPVFPSGYRTADPLVAPSRAEWNALVASRRAAAAAPGEPVVDVIVPVYGGSDATLRCLYSVLTAANRTPHAVVVIDDASPNEELSLELRRLADAGLFELSRNERNVGFVVTCNRGMSRNPRRDVVLLNSDTEVYGDWLDRLRAAALSGNKKIGTVTPLSNNATICSYPYFVRDNDMALELPYGELDALAAVVNAGRSCPVPTAVGFCMYVRRACLDDIGLFDAERFGLGYGEENDFCLRASARGWQHLMAYDVFVRHAGGVSFGPEKDARIKRALAEIARHFPDYAADVARFVEKDPPRDARARLDLARMERWSGSGAILFVTHDWGGGIERHVEELRRRLKAEDVAIFFLRAEANQTHRAVLSHPSVWPAPNLGPFDLRADVAPLVEALRRLDIGHIHVHSLVGFDQPTAARWIPRVARALGVPYDFTAHDYLCMCPRMTLIDGSGTYCGEPELEECERCVGQNGSAFGQVGVRAWRDAYASLLQGARAVIAPGNDVAARIARHFRGVTPMVRAHVEDAVALGAPGPRRRARGETLRVAVIGAIHPHKGFDVLRECARDAAARNLPIAFRLVGYSSDDDALRRWGNVEILGPYDGAELPRILARERCHCALFPSVWPETHSYTLSAAIAAGLHPVAFDLGVPAERIRSLGWGTLLPVDATPAAVNGALLATDSRAAPDPQKVRAHFPAYPSIVRDYYGLTALPPSNGAAKGSNGAAPRAPSQPRPA
jgi:GT2 family glycosyltransferase/glycosyltransferase involved in cell wall biosynthesis